jgi:ribose transport system permease protein
VIKNRSWSIKGTDATLIVISVVGYLALTIYSRGDFLSSNSIRTFLTFLAVPVLIGLAQMVALCVGQLNLAVGALGGFLACLMAVLMVDNGLPMPLVLVIGLVCGAVIGAVTGLIIVGTRINGFIVTLATMTILMGGQYKLVGTRTVDGYSESLKSFGEATVGPIPVIFILALLVAGALAWFYRRTVEGRKLLASGGNPVAARLSGISNDRSVVIAHSLSGLVIGVAAVISVASLPGVNASVGGDWLLPSFAAPIIGGVPLVGGGVAVLGTVLAAFIIRLVDSARALLSLDPSVVNFVIGAVVLGTVITANVRANRATLAKSRRVRTPVIATEGAK